MYTDRGNELASCILLRALWFVQTFMELDLKPVKGGGILRKIMACPRCCLQSDWSGPPQTHSTRALGEKKLPAQRQGGGREGPGHPVGPLDGHCEKFACGRSWQLALPTNS